MIVKTTGKKQLHISRNCVHDLTKKFCRVKIFVIIICANLKKITF